MTANKNENNPLDAATSRRLAQLANRPVDTTSLEQKLAATLNKPAQPPNRWWSAAMGLAASVVLAGSIFFAVMHSGTRAEATMIELSQLHHDMVSGELPLTPVDSIDEANAWIAAQSQTSPRLPRHLTSARVRSCCLADVHGELVAVAMLKTDTAVVTLVVAEAPTFAHEMGTVIEIGGRRFFGHKTNGIQMMMANQGDRWLCVMGDRSAEALAEIAAGIHF